MESALCSASKLHPSPFCRDCVGDPSAVWDRPSSPFWAPSRRGRNRKQEEEDVRRKRRPNESW